jgi:hypothetical protein
MGRRSSEAYDNALGLRESETLVAETFEADFPAVTGRTVKVIDSEDHPPDRAALVDGVETGVELTAIHAGNAEDAIAEIVRLAHQKDKSYKRHGVFAARPTILLGHLDWPARDVEGPALYDFQADLAKMIDPNEFSELGFSEIWMMDGGAKYSSRRDPRAPADFFCFAPSEKAGFWEQERKRRPYWSMFRDFLM